MGITLFPRVAAILPALEALFPNSVPPGIPLLFG